MALNNELNILISQLERAGVSTREFSRQLAQAGDNQEEIIRLTREMQQTLSNTEGTAGNLYTRLQQVTAELGRNNKSLNLARGAYSKILSIAQQLSDDEAGITDLNKNQVKRLLEQAKVKAKLAKDSVDNLSVEERLTEAGQALIAAKEDEHKEAEEVIRLAEERLAQEKRISKQMGVTGAIIGGTGALMERLGMRSGIFQDAIEDAQEAMRSTAKQADILGKKVSKAQLAFIGVSKVAKGFGRALFDPLTITSAIVSKFFELNAASTKLMRLTGQNAGIQAAHNQSLASGAQVMEIMAEMTQKTGIAASAIFSSEDLGRLAEAKNLLGLSSEQASNLGMFSKVSGTSIQGYKEELVASVNEFNAMNDSAIAHGVIIQDVLNASADVSMSLGGSAPKIAAAAAAARKLGLDLTKVNQIADGLLDFESSIESELEAQLLTGKNINLSKARELALNNDLEGVANELAKNGASAAEFANMNRIQQEGMAKALGMSREEMGKMLINQEGQKNLSKEQRAAMRGVTLEQLEQMEASESLKLAFSKMAEPLASILNTLAPIVTRIAKAVAFIAPIATPIFLAVKAFQLLNSGILGSIKNMGKLLTSTSLFGKMYKGGQFMPGGGRAAAGGERAGGLLSNLFGKKGVGQVPQGAGETAGRGITSVSDSISKIDMKKVLQGAAAMAIVAGAVFIFGKAVQQFTEVSWGDVGKAVVGMLALVGAVALVGAIMMSGVGAIAILAGAAAMLIMASAVLVLGYGVQALATGFNTMLPNLINLATMAPQLFLVGGALMSIAAGLGAIAIAGIAAIPALAALSGFALMATPLIAIGGLFGDGGNEDTGMAELSAKLDTLISVVSAGGNVYLDGNKVGEAQVLGTYKLS
jgi:hypothetical protein